MSNPEREFDDFDIGPQIDEDPRCDEAEDHFRDDVEADADVLRMAGFGTDEDYGFYGEEEMPF